MDVFFPPGVHVPSPIAPTFSFEGRSPFPSTGGPRVTSGRNRFLQSSMMSSARKSDQPSPGMKSEGTSTASPLSVEIDAISPGQWERGFDARQKLDQFHGQVIEEVDSDYPAPATRPNLEEPYLGSLPRGLVAELDAINSASRELLSNIENIEKNSQRFSSTVKVETSSVRSNGSAKQNTKERVTTRSNRSPSVRTRRIGKQQRLKGITKTAENQPKPSVRHIQRKLPVKRASNTPQRTNREQETQTGSVKRIGRTLPVSPKRQQQKPQARNSRTAETQTNALRQINKHIPTKTRQTRIPAPAGARSVQTNTNPVRHIREKVHSHTSEKSQDKLIRSELDSLRNELERLRSFAHVKTNISEVRDDTTDLLKTFPDLTEAIVNMEHDTSLAASELHRRIETLIKSYRDMNTIAASAPLGFLSAVDPHGTLSSSTTYGTKLPEWMPKIDEFDHQVLQAEAEDIMEHKREIETRLGKLLHMPTEELGSTQEIGAQVEKTIRKVDQDIHTYVDQVYTYNSHRQKGRPRYNNRSKDDSPLAAWMGSTVWSGLQKQSKSKVPVHPPPIPRVLQLAQREAERQERNAEALALLEAKKVKPEQQSSPAKEAITTKTKVPKQRRKVPGKQPTRQAGRRRKPSRKPSPPPIEKKEDDEFSVDSITNFLDQLEERRNIQEVFEASEKARTTSDKSAPPPEVMNTRISVRVDTKENEINIKKEQRGEQQREEDVILVENEEENVVGQEDEETDRPLLKVAGRLERFQTLFKAPHVAAVRAAYESCCSVITQTSKASLSQSIPPAVKAAMVSYSQIHQLYQLVVVDILSEELIAAQEKGLIDGGDILQLLTVVDGAIRKLHRELAICDVIAVVCTSYHAATGTPLSAEGKDALLSCVLQHEGNLTKALEMAGHSARAVHSTMYSQPPAQRIESAVHAAESTFYGIAGTKPGPVIQSAIQSLAVLGTKEQALGELELSNIHTVLCQIYSVEDAAIQTTVRCVMSVLVGYARSMKDARLQSSRGGERLIGSWKEHVTEEIKQLSEELLNQKEVCDESKPLIEYVLGVFSSGPSDVKVEMFDPLRGRIAVNAAAEYVLSSAAPKDFGAALTLVNQVSERIGMSLQATAGIVRHIQDEGKKSYDEKLYSAVRERPDTIQGEGGKLEKVPLGGIRTDPGLDTLEPAVAPIVPTQEQVQSYISSSILAEMLVRQHNAKGKEAQMIDYDESSNTTNSLLSGRVVQWFVDRGEIVDDESMREAASLAIREECSQGEQKPVSSSEGKPPSSGEHHWSDDSILDMVTKLYLDTLQAEEKIPQQKPADPVESEETTTDLEYIAASNLSLRLAAESSERAVKEREVSIRAQLEELDNKRETLAKMELDMKTAAAEASLAERKLELDRLRQDIERREELQSNLEQVRTDQMNAAIERVSSMQMRTFSMAIEKVKELTFGTGAVAKETEHVVENLVAMPVEKPQTQTFATQTDPLDDETKLDEEEVHGATESKEEYEEVKLDEAKSEDEAKSDEEDETQKFEKEESSLLGEGEQKNEGKLLASPLKVMVDTGIGEDDVHEVITPRSYREHDEEQPGVAARGFTSTLLDWDSSDDSSVHSHSTDVSRSLSEGELDVIPGDYSDGEHVPLYVAYRSVLKPRMTAPPWGAFEGPDPKLLHQKLSSSGASDTRGGDTGASAQRDTRSLMLTPEELEALKQRYTVGLEDLETEDDEEEEPSSNSSSGDDDVDLEVEIGE